MSFRNESDRFWALCAEIIAWRKKEKQIFTSNSKRAEKDQKEARQLKSSTILWVSGNRTDVIWSKFSNHNVLTGQILWMCVPASP